MLTAWTEHHGHKYVVSYTHKTYAHALTVVYGWYVDGLISGREAKVLYRQMYAEWKKCEELCKGK